MKVELLIEVEIGFGPLDTGSLADSANQEPGTPIYGNMITLREASEEGGWRS